MQPWGAEPGGSAVAGEVGVRFLEADFAEAAAPECVVTTATEAIGPPTSCSSITLVAAMVALPSSRPLRSTRSFTRNVWASLLLVREFATRHGDSRAGGRVVLLTSG
jgi:3-oxoacyl-[acyl-carrier protein] reductase